MRCLEMTIQAILTWPQLRKTDKAQIKWIACHVIGDAAVVLVRGFDECSQVRKNFGDLFRWKSKYSKHGYFWIHSFILDLQKTI
jgi:hypothetical protein